MNTPAPVTFAVTVNEPGVTQTHTAALDPAQHDEAAPGLLLFGLAARALRALDLPAPTLAAEQDDAPAPTDLAAALRDDMDTASGWDAGEDEDLREAAAALAHAARAIVDADAAMESAAHRAASAGQGHRLLTGNAPAWRAIVDAVAPLAGTWETDFDAAEQDDAPALVDGPAWERFRLVRRTLADLAEIHGFKWDVLAPKLDGSVPINLAGSLPDNPWSAAFTMPPTGDPERMIRMQLGEAMREARAAGKRDDPAAGGADDAEDVEVTDADVATALRRAIDNARSHPTA